MAYDCGQDWKGISLICCIKAMKVIWSVYAYLDDKSINRVIRFSKNYWTEFDYKCENILFIWLNLSYLLIIWRKVSKRLLIKLSKVLQTYPSKIWITFLFSKYSRSLNISGSYGFFTVRLTTSLTITVRLCFTSGKSS